MSPTFRVAVNKVQNSRSRVGKAVEALCSARLRPLEQALVDGLSTVCVYTIVKVWVYWSGLHALSV